MLLRMYLRWTADRGFETEILEASPGEEAGLKSTTVAEMKKLWEPAAQRQFLRAFTNGEFSARRVLRSCALRVIAPRAPIR